MGLSKRAAQRWVREDTLLLIPFQSQDVMQFILGTTSDEGSSAGSWFGLEPESCLPAFSPLRKPPKHRTMEITGLLG